MAVGVREEIAKVLGGTQDSVSRLEKRSDLLLSTLRKTVKAMGGEVRIVAEFRDRRPVLLLDLSGSGHRTRTIRRRRAVEEQWRPKAHPSTQGWATRQ
jgi:hypothetical protein